MKTLIYTTLILVAVIVVCCSNNPVTTNNALTSSTILHTDSLGNVISGDTTDWCLQRTCSSYILPAFPNPTNNKTTFAFHLGSNDTVSLYTLRSPSDTIFIINNIQRQAGNYQYWVYGDSLNLHNVTTKFYFKVKKTCTAIDPNHPCSFTGDVQFN